MLSLVAITRRTEKAGLRVSMFRVTLQTGAKAKRKGRTNLVLVIILFGFLLMIIIQTPESNTVLTLTLYRTVREIYQLIY